MRIIYCKLRDSSITEISDKNVALGIQCAQKVYINFIATFQ